MLVHKNRILAEKTFASILVEKELGEKHTTIRFFLICTYIYILAWYHHEPTVVS